MAPFVGRLGEFQARALKLFLDAIERERAKKHGEPIYNFSHDRERRAFLQRICDESNSWLFKRVQEFTKDAIMFGRLLEHINEFGVIVDHSGCSQKDHCGTKCFYRRGLNLLKPRAIRRLAELPLDTGDFSPSSMLPLKPLKHDSEGLVGSMAVGDYRRRSSRIFELVCASEHAVPTGGNGEDTPLLSITKRRKTRQTVGNPGIPTASQMIEATGHDLRHNHGESRQMETLTPADVGNGFARLYRLIGSFVTEHFHHIARYATEQPSLASELGENLRGILETVLLHESASDNEIQCDWTQHTSERDWLRALITRFVTQKLFLASGSAATSKPRRIIRRRETIRQQLIGHCTVFCHDAGDITRARVIEESVSNTYWLQFCTVIQSSVQLEQANESVKELAGDLSTHLQRKMNLYLENPSSGEGHASSDSITDPNANLSVLLEYSIRLCANICFTQETQERYFITWFPPGERFDPQAMEEVDSNRSNSKLDQYIALCLAPGICRFRLRFGAEFVSKAKVCIAFPRAVS